MIQYCNGRVVTAWLAQPLQHSTVQYLEDSNRRTFQSGDGQLLSCLSAVHSVSIAYRITVVEKGGK
jgi:hypothetical protein